MPTEEEIFLAGFSEEERRAFLAIGQERAFEPGAFIVRQGAPGSSLFILREGQASVWKGDVKLADIAAGSVFGESILFQAHNRIAAIRADTPTLLSTA